LVVSFSKRLIFARGVSKKSHSMSTELIQRDSYPATAAENVAGAIASREIVGEGAWKGQSRLFYSFE